MRSISHFGVQKQVFIVAEFIVCYLGAIVSALVLILLLKNKSLQTRGNFYVGNLAFACVIGGFSVPIANLLSSLGLPAKDQYGCVFIMATVIA